MIAWWASLGTKRWLVAIAGVALVLLLASAALLLLAQRAPDLVPSMLRPGPDPWTIAVKQAQDLLDESPDFEDHMRSYRSISTDVDGYLGLVERARVPLNISDQLRKTNLPVVGNAWQVLIGMLNIGLSGSGQMLDSLDDSLRQLLAFKGRLATLRDADAVAVAVRQFQANPSRKTLLALRDSCTYYKPVLDEADRDLQPHTDLVSRAVDRLGNIEQGFRSIEDALSRLRPVANAVAALRQAVSDLFEPLRKLQMALDGLHSQIQSDLVTMTAIESIVAEAEQAR